MIARIAALPAPPAVVWRILGLVIAAAIGGLPLAAQETFFEPIRVTDGSGRAAQAALGVDQSQNAYVVSAAEDCIRVRILGTSVSFEAPVTEGHPGQGDPAIDINPFGIAFIAFAQEDPAGGGGSREIFLTDTLGGGFRAPANISRSPQDDYGPRLRIDKFGDPHLAWMQNQGGASRIIYRRPGENPVPVASGEYPGLALDGNNAAHLVYQRGADLYYIANRAGRFEGEIPVVQSPLVEEFSQCIGVAADGAVLVLYESGGILYLTAKTGLVFDPPRRVAEAGAYNPDLQVSGASVAIAYEQQGDIYFRRGTALQLSDPAPAFRTASVESHAALRLDLQGALHLGFLRDGDVYYSNNSPSPAADFQADPEGGEVPVLVQFTDLSTGNIRSRKWDFGDGQTSIEKNPAHLYALTGRYTVSLEVLGPGGASRLERPDNIFVQDRINTMRIPPVAVFPGERNVWVPVIGTFKEPIQGFQITGRFDPAVLTLAGATIDNTITGFADPDIFEFNNSTDPEDPYYEPGNPYFSAGMVVVLPDDEGGMGEATRKILPADERRLLNLIFHVSPLAFPGTIIPIELVNRVGPARLSCLYVVNAQDRIPGLTSGAVTIRDASVPLPRKFLRGDVDGDGTLGLTDAITLLQFLFLGTSLLDCEDAADTADTGLLDISGAIQVLSYLFLGGQEPLPPFPLPGLDPTEDELATCF